MRDVDADGRAVLVHDGYEEFRLTCVTPSGTRAGSLYAQAFKSAEEMASHVEKAGLALFGGCTTMEVRKCDCATILSMPHSNMADLMSEPVERN